MKKHTKVLALMLALAVLMSMSAFAEDVGYTVTAEGNSGAVATESTAGSFKLTANADEGEMYLLLVLAGNAALPDKDNILYVNQETASGDTVTFEKVYPKAIANSSIYLAGGEDGLTKIATLAVDEPAGYNVTGNVTSYLVADGEVTVALFAEGAETAAYTTTTTNGTYSLTDVANGTYTMKVSKYGHVSREYAVEIADGAVVQDVRICTKGDVDEDGSILFSDLQRLYLHLSTADNKLVGYALSIGDVDEDGTILFSDLQRLYLHLSTADNKLF